MIALNLINMKSFFVFQLYEAIECVLCVRVDIDPTNESIMDNEQGRAHQTDSVGLLIISVKLDRCGSPCLPAAW